MNIISQIGIELEGAWPNTTIHEIESSSLPITGCADGSLSGRLPLDHSWWEIQTEPVAYENLSTLWKTIDTYAPKHYNHTCGLHIHTSFISDDLYSIVASKSFVLHMRKELTQFYWNLVRNGQHSDEILRVAERFLHRLEGNNSYCKREVKIIPQLFDNGGQRYSFLNYCYSKHQTLECRVFPMMPAPLIKEAVRFYLEALLYWGGWNKVFHKTATQYFTFYEKTVHTSVANEGGA